MFNKILNLIYKIIVKLNIDIYLSDYCFIKFQHHALMGTKLDLSNPITYNQKLNWIKLYDRNPLYTTIVDKLAVKEWVISKLGTSDNIIPTLAVYDSVSSIDINTFPKQFVLKTTHSGDSLGVIICKDKEIFKWEDAKRNLEKSLKTDYYLAGREWPYKNVPRKIILEQYMEDEYGELRDYKFFCFNGEVRALFVATDRSSGNVCFDYFDKDFNHLDLTQSHPMSCKIIQKPKNFEEMINIASNLSRGIPQVRVDLYNVDGKIYFGEMTLFHYGGNVAFHPSNWDYIFGEWIDLRLCKKNNSAYVTK